MHLFVRAIMMITAWGSVKQFQILSGWRHRDWHGTIGYYRTNLEYANTFKRFVRALLDRAAEFL